MFWLLLIITYTASVHVYTVYIPFFIEEKMLLYVWGMGNLDLYHTLVEGSDNLWLIIATKNKKKKWQHLLMTHKHSEAHLVSLSSNYQFPFWMRSCPTPIWLSFWDNQIKFLITLHVGTTILHVGTTVHVIILHIATTRVYVGTTNSSSLL